MNRIGVNRTSLIFAFGLVAAGIVAAVWLQPARAQSDASPGATPHYSIVETQGHNLIVADNHTNMLYFYTIDQDKEVGSELKLRGKIDLSQVGRPVIKPVTHKSEQ